MNALLRSLALGLGIGTAVLAATLWSTKAWQPPREPRLFPGSEEALGALTPSDAGPSIIDPQVRAPMALENTGSQIRPVQHEAAGNVPGTTGLTGKKTALRLVAITETRDSPLLPLRWRIDPTTRELRLFRHEPTLILTGIERTQAITIRDLVTKKVLVDRSTPGQSDWQVGVTRLKPGTNHIGIYSGDEPAPEIELVLHLPVQTESRLNLITDYSPGSTGALRSYTSSLTLFGSSPIVVLTGQSLLEGERLAFYQTSNSADAHVEAVPIRRFDIVEGTPGGWKAELLLSGPPGNKSELLLQTISGASHRVMQVSPTFTIKTFDTLQPPVVAQVANQRADLPKVFSTTTDSLNITIDKPSTDADLLVLVNGSPRPAQVVPVSPDKTTSIKLSGLNQGRNSIVFAYRQGDGPTFSQAPLIVDVRTGGFTVAAVEPPNFGTAAGVTSLRIQFSRDNPVQWDEATTSKLFELRRSNGTGRFDGISDVTVALATDTNNKPLARFDSRTNTITLTFKDIPVDVYQLTINKALSDIYGNSLEGEPGRPNTAYTVRLSELASVEASPPTELRGIVTTTGRYVPFPEYTKPRPDQNGFNPSDKVETRVARLYYFRDAHRVAQIINRKVKSHNRQGVDAARQLADRARQIAEQKAVFRQQSERAAIEKARKTREKEADLQRAEQAQQRSLQELSAAKLTDPPPDATLITQLESAARSFASQVDRLRGDVQKLRDEENVANEQVQQAEAEERLSREEQFRREVAAARADPDTYAEGVPESQDPVEQVSVSVIGEGLIQLRGPIKGINLIRTMIDQIDSPVGQVRVAVHTVQLNGERADRMEEVAATSQRYIDQARFLTLQSGELLRRSIVQVAAQRADESRALYPGEAQEDRDQRYLYAFFGRDFIDELKAMDSEFLRTGNKLLSLHSMDTTSLSSALTLMALARNDTRLQILQQFEELCRGELPRAEQSFFEQSFHCGIKKHSFGSLCKPPPFVPLAGNANFESLRGFFAADIANQDTMSPLQREFLRLAQILKSRLIVELEYKQRVTERAVIEERLGDRLVDLQVALDRERKAEQDLDIVRNEQQRQQVSCVRSIKQVRALASAFLKNLTAADRLSLEVSAPLRKVVEEIEREFLSELDAKYAVASPKQKQQILKLRDTLQHILANKESLPTRKAINEALIEVCNYRQQFFQGDSPERAIPRKNGEAEIAGVTIKYQIDRPTPDGKVQLTIGDGNRELYDKIRGSFAHTLAELESRRREADLLEHTPHGKRLLEESDAALTAARRIQPTHQTGPASAEDLIAAIDKLQIAADKQAEYWRWVNEVTTGILRRFDDLVVKISARDSDIANLYGEWLTVTADLYHFIRPQHPIYASAKETLDEATEGIVELLQVSVRHDQSRQLANEARRPLDHKKFLDMLIDETEDKYIELLEGTRAHTANIDNYIKRLTTALDDDFNTQFYNPAFRLVRESSAHRYYNVQFGQIETTSILANNRAFAKVSPAASMEFDLPQRDILITEALNGARALMNDVGALANDPTFLAMAKLNAGQSSASPPAGSTGGFSVVRNVVPGLAGDTTEQVIAQNANGGPQFGSNLENLIPDPAVYKFETGTGYEIRPVIQPDGQAVVFGFHYLYSTQIREPVRADEKHLGRIKRHFIDTDVQLSNFELREVSRYIVALKASRTSRGVPLFEDIPIAGALFRPAPSDESSLQQNVVLAQATIFPTLFDLMGLRWAPVVADLDPLRLQTDEFTVRGRNRMLRNRVFDVSSEKVDDFLRMPPGQRRSDLYRTQESIPVQHPNGYEGPGLNQQDSQLREGYSPTRTYRPDQYAPPGSREGSPFLPGRSLPSSPQPGQPPLQEALPRSPDPQPLSEPTDPRLQGASQRRSSIPPRAASATPYPPGPSSPPGTPASYGRAPSGQPPAFQVSGPQQLGR